MRNLFGVTLFVCLALIGCGDQTQPQFEDIPQEFRGFWVREYTDNEGTPYKEKLQISENSYKSTRYEKESEPENYVKKNETMYSASWFKGQLILERNNNYRIIYYDPVVEDGVLILDKRSSIRYTRSE
jgi:hypothetical protein